MNVLLAGRTWLGREFLTWLLWKSESTEPITLVDGRGVTVVFNGKLTLRAGSNEVVKAQVEGVTSPYSKLVKKALSQHMLVHTAKLQVTHREQIYDFVLDADTFDIKSAKLPALMTEFDDDKLTERLELARRAAELIDALMREFIDERLVTTWTETVDRMREWMVTP